MIDAVQRVAGTAKLVRQEKARVRPEKSEVKALTCDYGKARGTFGYQPSVSFEDGLARVRDYIIERGSPSDVTAYRI
jgi:nucleoside-diphosphate-sugar epimerase